MRLAAIVSIALLVVLACDVSVNKSLRVEDGETRSGGLTTVNGNITVGENCTINGTCRAVNGRIRIGKNSDVEDLQSVNGSIDIASGVKVRGDISSVNGSVSCATGVEIEDELNTVNGSIDFIRTTLGRDITTVNGDIALEQSSLVGGSIIVKGESDKGSLEIRITGNSKVKGDIRVDADRRGVTVYLSDGGKVLGQIENARIVED